MRIAKSTVLSDDAFSVMVLVLDQVLGWNSGEIGGCSSRMAWRSTNGSVPERIASRSDRSRDDRRDGVKGRLQ